MKEVGAFEAKNRFGQLLDWVEAGEEVVITRRGKVASSYLDHILETPADNIYLRSGDLVSIEPLKRTYSVFGAVERKGNIEFGKSRLNLMEAVSKASGLDSYRADAKGQMLQVAQYMHRFYAANDRFDQNRATTANTSGELVPASMKRSPADGTQLYELTVDATQVAFTVTAVPLVGGKMAADPCGSLTLTSTGVRGVAGATLSRDECWK